MVFPCINYDITFLYLKVFFVSNSAIEGKLYAVGGRNAAGELSTVECYNPQLNEWIFVEKMREPHYGHAGSYIALVLFTWHAFKNRHTILLGRHGTVLI